MKSAEEWVNLDTGSVLFHCAEDYATDKDWIELVKQIQLDAWKQGMEEAVTELIGIRHRFPMSSIEMVEAQKAIMKRKNDRKEI